MQHCFHYLQEINIIKTKIYFLYNKKFYIGNKKPKINLLQKICVYFQLRQSKFSLNF